MIQNKRNPETCARLNKPFVGTIFCFPMGVCVDKNLNLNSPVSSNFDMGLKISSSISELTHIEMPT